MPISPNILQLELQKFQDQQFPGFEGFPISVLDAKKKWGDALQAYINTITVLLPPTVTPPNSSLDTSKFGSTYTSTVQMLPIGTPPTTALDMATAWATAMLSLVPIPGALYLGPAVPIATIVSIVPFATIPINQVALTTELTAQFADIASPAVTKMLNLAVAFHKATLSSLATTCVYTNPAGTPPTLPGPLAFG